MMCALASSIVGSAASTVAGPGTGASTNPAANTRAIVSPNAKTTASACTVAGPKPRTVAVGSCAVLGIVAHAVSVRIHKRAATLGGPVTSDLRGPCGTAAQRIACAFQPCGTRASPRAIYLGVIRRARLHIQATGRRGRSGASPGARSLTDRRDAGCRHGRGRTKRHRSYQGDCDHAHTVILMHSFHLAPLSVCKGRRLVLCGDFCPLRYQYEPEQHFLAPVFEILFRLQRKAGMEPENFKSLCAPSS